MSAAGARQLVVLPGSAAWAGSGVVPVRRGGFATQQAAWKAREFLRNPDDIDHAEEIVTVGAPWSRTG